MSTSVFTDPIRGAAILVSDDPMYALGPVLVADDINEATEAMLAFVAALEVDPSECPTIRLMVEWQGFLGALSGTVVAVPLDTQEPPSDDPGEISTPGRPEPVTALSEAQDAPEADLFDDDGRADETVAIIVIPGPEGSVIGPDGPEDDDEDDDEAADELHNRLAQVPGGTPRQRGLVECFACQGTGHPLGLPDQTCNLCNGEGKIPEPEPVATTTTQEDEEQ